MKPKILLEMESATEELAMMTKYSFDFNIFTSRFRRHKLSQNSRGNIFIEGIDEHTPLIRKENELNDSVDEIKRKFPNVDTSKFISEIDEYGRVKVK